MSAGQSNSEGHLHIVILALGSGDDFPRPLRELGNSLSEIASHKPVYFLPFFQSQC